MSVCARAWSKDPSQHNKADWRQQRGKKQESPVGAVCCETKKGVAAVVSRSGARKIARQPRSFRIGWRAIKTAVFFCEREAAAEEEEESKKTSNSISIVLVGME